MSNRKAPRRTPQSSLRNKTLLSTDTGMLALDNESLREENEELRAELTFIKSLYKQLMEEIPSEKFDERRVNLLKSQIIQLERQVLLQSTALSARTTVLLELENKLQNIRDSLKSLSPHDSASGQVVMPSDQLNSLLSMVEGGRRHLYKTIENSSTQALSLPAIYMGTFLKQTRPADKTKTTLLDLCSGKLEHLNLKYVSGLESKLCKLYKKMLCLQKTLSHQLPAHRTAPFVMSEHIAEPIRDKAATHRTVGEHTVEPIRDKAATHRTVSEHTVEPIRDKAATHRTVSEHRVEPIRDKAATHRTVSEHTVEPIRDKAATHRTVPLVMNEHIAEPIRDRVAAQVTCVSQMLKDCCDDLLYLSVLIPAAPWPALKKPLTPEITVADIMRHLPDLSKRKSQEVRSVMETLNKAVSYTKHMLHLEIKILTEELKFHQQVYEQQVDYAESLFSAVSKAFAEFEETSREILCAPLQDVLNAYAELKDNASEESLRIFLVKFKERSGELTRIVESLQSHSQDGTGSSTISQFGQHFVDSMNALTRECISKRDSLMKEILETKSQMFKMFSLFPLVKYVVIAVKDKLGSKDEVDEILQKLSLSTDKLQEVMHILRQDFENGLSADPNKREASPIKMLPTYVRALPDGTEVGAFLALDLGGTNFRVLLIQIHDGEVHIENDIYRLSHELMTSDADTLFDYIANCIEIFTKKRGIQDLALPLGFTFSFPVDQLSLTSGLLIRWTKGFTATGTEGNDVVELLKLAMERKKNRCVNVVALVNDTTGTMMSCAFKNSGVCAGLILGTGTNACYMESFDSVDKWNGDQDEPRQVIINTEWGAFGDNGSLAAFRLDYDETVDQQSLNPGQQLFEKMISGMYLGELARLVCVDLIKKGLLFGGIGSEIILRQGSFLTLFVSDIETGDKEKYLEVLNQLEVEGTEKDCEIMQRVCNVVSKRAARLASAGLATIIKKTNKFDSIVAVDGTLFKKHPRFKGYMQSALEELLPNSNVKLMQSEDGSGKGAALVAAVAVKMAAKA